jgi:calcium/calmodulin-dependent protein kinase I
VVKKCRDVVTGAIYAVKIIDKKEMVKSSASVVKQEIEILKAVGSHPNIVQLVDHYEDNSKHYLIMELCLGGDLFSQIVEHGKYSEAEAAVSCKQLADALRHIHSCGITHRDLKPENILLIRADPSSPLKLADFGLSKLIKGHLHPMRTVCGSVLMGTAGLFSVIRVNSDEDALADLEL